MKADSLQKYICSAEGIERLSLLYSDNVASKLDRFQEVIGYYKAIFGNQEIVAISSPGRTELGGNHTDHQNGCVLCAAISNDILCVAGKRDDGMACLECRGFGHVFLDLNALEPRMDEFGKTSALVRGMASLFVAKGYPVGGFNAVVISDIPVGGGFSSSAAFEILIGNLFMALYAPECKLTPVEIAKLGKQTENLWFGKPCGLMDQCACSIGGISFLDFYDPSEPQFEKIRFDFAQYGYSLGTISVGSSHADLTEDYAAIPREMRSIAAYFGKTHLRYVDEIAFNNSMTDLILHFSSRAINRAIHFFSENKRSSAMAFALKNGNINDYCSLMNESGRSSERLLGNIVPDSNPQEKKLADALAFCSELLNDDESAFRVHGGGFGGSVQVLIPNEQWSYFQSKAELKFGIDSCRKISIRSNGGTILIGDTSEC